MLIEGHVPDPALNYVASFSGGKDSCALWLYLTKELKLPHVTCIFADTGHEASITHQYLDLLEKQHGLPLVRLQPTLEDFRGELKEENIRERMRVTTGDPVWLDPAFDVWSQHLDMERLAILKRRFPSTMTRFCTSHLKQRPCSRWLKANCDPQTILATGVRAQESEARAAKCTFALDKMSGLWLWMPIHKLTHEEVFALHAKWGIPPNPLYLLGAGRVGCYPCIMARKVELAAIANRNPACFDNLLAMEQRVAKAVGKPMMSFFSNYKCPARFHSGVDVNGKTFPTADDVRRWAMEAVEELDEFDKYFVEDAQEDGYACSSVYGLCE